MLLAVAAGEETSGEHLLGGADENRGIEPSLFRCEVPIDDLVLLARGGDGLTTWMHHEGYQQLSQRIDLPVLRELIVKPGMLTGLSGQYVGPVNSAACKEQKCEDLTLGKPLRLCVTPNFHKSSLTHQTQQASYELLKKLPGEVCSGLLPKIKVSCSESYLLELKIPSDGSMGAETHIGIYGLMTDPKGEQRVWPLRFFPNKT